MNILSALGVNTTIWIQLACFLVSYLALSELVFKPYMAAYHERQNRTAGNEDFAQRLLQQAEEVQTQYELSARQLNNQTKSIFDESRTIAMREYDQTVAAARQEAQELLEKTRTQINKAVTDARVAVLHEAPQVGMEIASKLMGKEISR